MGELLSGLGRTSLEQTLESRLEELELGQRLAARIHANVDVIREPHPIQRQQVERDGWRAIVY